MLINCSKNNISRVKEIISDKLGNEYIVKEGTKRNPRIRISGVDPKSANKDTFIAEMFKQTEQLKSTCSNNVKWVFSFDQISSLLSVNRYDIFAVTETWLNKDILSEAVAIDGYEFYRRDRAGRGGGVGFYVKNSLQCNSLDFHMENAGSNRLICFLYDDVDKLKVPLGSYIKKKIMQYLYPSIKKLKKLVSFLAQIGARARRLVLRFYERFKAGEDWIYLICDSYELVITSELYDRRHNIAVSQIVWKSCLYSCIILVIREPGIDRQPMKFLDIKLCHLGDVRHCARVARYVLFTDDIKSKIKEK
nr:unnamed protein product [Callosobruchus analis]